MIRFLRNFTIMALAFGVMLALLSAMTCARHLLIAPAQAMSCAEIKAAIDTNGESAVRAWAKAHGMSERQIEALKRRCEIQ